MPSDSQNLTDWLVLVRAPGLGPRRIAVLLESFKSPAEILAAPVDALHSACPALPQTATDSLKQPDWHQIEQDQRWFERPGRGWLAITDTNYPPLLREIDEPPPILFVLGQLAVLNDPQIAVVGSRSPTPDGHRNSFDFSRYFASAGLSVCSGLASGIDAAAHRGALAAGGATLAVIGTGLDRVYPRENHDLAHAIVEQGSALISEFALGTPPRAGNFPRRNRIISGLSLAVLVVEAARRSGSLITARLASEQGRDVFAIPGSIHNPLAKGCHRLIREGAKLVESGSDLLEEIAPQLRHRLTEEALGDSLAGVELGADGAVENTLMAAQLAPDQRQLLSLIPDRPIAIDELVQASGLTVAAVSSMLLILELEGHVRAAPGGLYMRTAVGKPE